MAAAPKPEPVEKAVAPKRPAAALQAEYLEQLANQNQPETKPERINIPAGTIERTAAPLAAEHIPKPNPVTASKQLPQVTAEHLVHRTKPEPVAILTAPIEITPLPQIATVAKSAVEQLSLQPARPEYDNAQYQSPPFIDTAPICEVIDAIDQPLASAPEEFDFITAPLPEYCEEQQPDVAHPESIAPLYADNRDTLDPFQEAQLPEAIINDPFLPETARMGGLLLSNIVAVELDNQPAEAVEEPEEPVAIEEPDLPEAIALTEAFTVQPDRYIQLAEDAQQTTVQPSTQHLTTPGRRLDFGSDRQKISIDTLNAVGTYEYKPDDGTSMLGTMAQLVQQKLLPYLPLGKCALQFSAN
jgi:hypothetical protein